MLIQRVGPAYAGRLRERYEPRQVKISIDGKTCPRGLKIEMKLQCRCGKTVVDSEATQKYRWMTTHNWTNFLNTIDSEIEKIGESSMRDQAIMNIRYAEHSGQIWECSVCKRLITIHEGNVISLVRE